LLTLYIKRCSGQASGAIFVLKNALGGTSEPILWVKNALGADNKQDLFAVWWFTLSKDLIYVNYKLNAK
jgi:hypothetical protein